jgi:hypothetical protein
VLPESDICQPANMHCNRQRLYQDALFQAEETRQSVTKVFSLMVWLAYVQIYTLRDLPF